MLIHYNHILRGMSIEITGNFREISAEKEKSGGAMPPDENSILILPGFRSTCSGKSDAPGP